MTTTCTAISPRAAALQIMERFERLKPSQKVSLKADSLINDALNGAGKAWSSEDRAFFTNLVYGVLRQWFLLGHLIGQLSKPPLAKIAPEARALLRLGLFQLRFLSHVPDYAALDSTVELARTRKLSTKTIAFINAILRGYQRREAAEGFAFPAWESDPEAHLNVCYSLPLWFIHILREQYAWDQILSMAKALKEPPPLTLRVNTLKTSVEACHRSLQEQGVAFTVPDDRVPECLVLEGFHGSPTTLPGYADGAFYVQDLSSAWVAHWVAPSPGETIIDLCAAPGSKTTHMAALMENRGAIWAVDPSPKRLETLRENLKRLDVSIVNIANHPAEEFSLPPETPLADAVLVDAPCSGMGTVRKHPEILLQLTEKQLPSFPPLQRALLEKGASFVRPGGRLVYSTCSVDKSENQDVVQAFLNTHPDFQLKREQQRSIDKSSDGFYLAELLRIN